MSESSETKRHIIGWPLGLVAIAIVILFILIFWSATGDDPQQDDNVNDDMETRSQVEALAFLPMEVESTPSL